MTGSRRIAVLAAAAVVALSVGGVAVAVDIEPRWIAVHAADTTSPEARLDYYRTAARNWPGRPTSETWWIALHLANANGERTLVDADQLVAGQHLSYLECHRGQPHGSRQCSTTTTTSPTTTSSTSSTLVSTTLAATSTSSSVAPTSTSSPNTSTTSTSVPSVTTSTSSTLPATSSTTTSTTSTTSPGDPPTGNVAAIGPGGALPSEATCAAQIVGMTENRPNNAVPNSTRGTSPHDEIPRVTGNFVGTTDEILQWVACKWGINVDWVRAQTAIESWWQQETIGDNGESFGVLQVRRPYHLPAFEDENAVRSTAYNADYAYAVWRQCINGELTWLNTVERGRQYAAGDGMGCLGVWFSGRWYTTDAVTYMHRVNDYFQQRIWTTPNFGPASPTGGTPSTTTTTASSTSTTTEAPATSTTTTVASTLPPTTTTTTTVPQSQSGFNATFASASDLGLFEFQLFTSSNGTPCSQNQNPSGGCVPLLDEFQGEHDTACHGPETYRDIVGGQATGDATTGLVYYCAPSGPDSGHFMTAVDTTAIATLTFSPTQTFRNVQRVCWDQNMTNLGEGKWLNVFIVPTADVVAHNGSFAYIAGSGLPYGGIPQRLPPTAVDFTWIRGSIMSHRVDQSGSYVREFDQWMSIDPSDTNGNGRIDPGDTPTRGIATDPAPRFTVCIDDAANRVVIERPDGTTDSYTYNIPFPQGDVRVIFEDASYNPTKHGVPAGVTWHWDNIEITVG